MEKEQNSGMPSGVKIPSNGQPKIMTKPLPEILDEIDASIRFANDAALDARKAAEEARAAGEKAANEAARVAAEAISKVEKVAAEALELSRLLKATILEANSLVNGKLNKTVR